MKLFTITKRDKIQLKELGNDIFCFLFYGLGVALAFVLGFVMCMAFYNIKIPFL